MRIYAFQYSQRYVIDAYDRSYNKNLARPRAAQENAMLELTIEQISMDQSAVDKPAALQLLADLLVADGLVAAGYLAGLQAREQQGSTFLGQGIAIPHGT